MPPHQSSKRRVLTQEAAHKLFDKTCNDKIKKGYVLQVNDASAGVEPLAAQTVEKEHSGFHCQLLTAISRDVAVAYCNDDQMIAQRKWDGVRKSVQRMNGAVSGINKLGQKVACSKAVADSLKTDNTLTDGEDIGQLIAFDALKIAITCRFKLRSHGRTTLGTNSVINTMLIAIRYDFCLVTRRINTQGIKDAAFRQ